MNISEFAEYAGVSKSAVSRYFNNGYLSDDKREQIEKAIEETGYSPSFSARAVKTRVTKLVGAHNPVAFERELCPYHKRYQQDTQRAGVSDTACKHLQRSQQGDRISRFIQAKPSRRSHFPRNDFYGNSPRSPQKNADPRCYRGTAV